MDVSNTRAKSEHRRRGALLSTGAALVAATLVLTGTLVLAACGDDDADSGDSSTSIPLAGAEAEPEGQEAFTHVEAAFTAFNTDDMDTWALWREGGRGMAADFDYESAAAARMDVEQCVY
ncbi:MAG: hypothetical protein ACR2PK_00480, partial [Acidimicrobiales bacterium]